MKKYNNLKTQENENRQLSPDELAEEERLYAACKKPIKVAWAIYAVAATLYISTGLFANSAVKQIPQKPPITESLESYKYSENYNDFVSAAQNEALNQFLAGEISLEDYQYVVDTISDDKKFEEFLRGLENDEFVQQTIADYDKYADQINEIGKKYSALTITALSSLLVSTIILAKYRFREMDIEDARKKRAESQSEQQMQ